MWKNRENVVWKHNFYFGFGNHKRYSISKSAYHNGFLGSLMYLWMLILALQFKKL